VHTQRWGETFRFNGCPLASNRRLKCDRGEPLSTRLWGSECTVDRAGPDNLIGRGIGPELRTRPPAPFVAAIVAIESDECARGGGRSPRGSLRFSFRPRGMRRRRVVRQAAARLK
jgi:hypothetical protein